MRHLGHVLDAHRHAAARGDDDVADLRDGLDAAAGAHDVAFAVVLDVARAAADVVGLQRLRRSGRRTGRSATSFTGSGWTWYCFT